MDCLLETADEGRRLDSLLADKTGLTRSRIQQLIAQQTVMVNGKPAAKNYRARLGDTVVCTIPPPAEYRLTAEPIPLEVAYEDGDIIVINKPRGMVVHPAPGHYTGTLVNALLYHCGGSLSGVNGELRPGIVHRIDRDTSGLLVAAKNDRAHQSLAAQLAERTMRRCYHAIAYGNIKKDCFTIDQSIARHPVDRKRMAVVAGGKSGKKAGESNDGSTAGRRAVTHVTVLERYAAHAGFGVFTLIEARLETGRTHQIRVHLAHAGHPLLGDTVYGGEKQPFHIEGQILHAKTLGFAHPATGKDMLFDSDLPPYFAEAAAKIKGSTR